MKFKLQKIDIAENAIYETETDNNLQAQDLGDKSPWVGYIVEGYGNELPEVGKSFQMFRTKRNNVNTLGLYITSKIQEVAYIDDKFYGQYYMFTTQNSVYRLYYYE